MAEAFRVLRKALYYRDGKVAFAVCLGAASAPELTLSHSAHSVPLAVSAGGFNSDSPAQVGEIVWIRVLVRGVACDFVLLEVKCVL